MPFDTATANSILAWAMAKSTLPTKSRVYIGLCTNDPEEDGGAFVELSGNTYARELVSQYNETYPDKIGSASGRAITNVKQINWTKATATWPLVKGFGIFETATGGSPYYYGKLDLTEEQKAAGGVRVDPGAVFLFDPAAMKISFTTADVTTAAAAASV